MKQALLFLCSLWLLPGITTTLLYAQTNTQTVKGTVTDKASEKPVAGVSVSVPGTNIRAVTNAQGYYILPAVPVGRQKLAFTYAGYGTVVIPEVLITSGKQVVTDIGMEQQFGALNGITVQSSRVKKGMADNEFAGSSARSFSMDEVTRYAGGRNDPARLATNLAGVATANDSRNDIVVRGNAPTAVLWRLEGTPIPNPNHFSTLGTAGGPVSALNTNALKNSDFYTSAFPAEYGNAVGAVFDLNLRAGNKDKAERLIQLNMFSGLEAMLEGPMGNKGASYLVGYRYSFAQIGQSLGFDVGTSAVPRYQDLVVNLNFPKTKAGSFNVFAMGGTAGIDFIGADIDSTDLFANKNEDSYFNSSFGVAGIKHTIDVGAKSYIRSVVSYSYANNDGQTYRYHSSHPDRRFEDDQRSRSSGIRLASYLNSKVNSRLTLRTGFTLENNKLTTTLLSREGKEEWAYLRNYDGTALLLQPYMQGRYRFTQKLSATAGLHGVYYNFNNKSAVEPRVNVQYALNNKQTFSLGYGLHSQLQPMPVYLYQTQLANGSYDNTNRQLGFTKANHYVAGYEWRFLPDWRLKAEAYYQHLYNAPVETIASGFSVLNAGADFTFPEKGFLQNKGTGTNRGIEITIEKFFSKGMYLLTTASLFNARYKGSDGIERNSTFNNKSVFNVLAGKEYKVGKRKLNTFSIDVKMTSAGGRYYTPVDLAQSIARNTEVLDESQYNALRLPAYFRLDTRFGLQLNSSKRKVSHAIYLDLQNITNRENSFIRRYNVVRKEVGTVNQIGFFPDILYRFQF